jgi:hypothetical protein
MKPLSMPLSWPGAGAALGAAEGVAAHQGVEGGQVHPCTAIQNSISATQGSPARAKPARPARQRQLQEILQPAHSGSIQRLPAAHRAAPGDGVAQQAGPSAPRPKALAGGPFEDLVEEGAHRRAAGKAVQPAPRPALRMGGGGERARRPPRRRLRGRRLRRRVGARAAVCRAE